VKKTILSTCIFLGLSATAAADFDGSKPLLCSTVTVNECVPGEGCEQVNNSEIGAPDFVRIDIRKKTMTGTADGAERPSNKIESSAVVGNSLFLQGKASGLEHLPEDSLAWSISVNQDTGDMVLTASGDEVAFVIFGSCIAP
jgi:hypothetical protein